MPVKNAGVIRYLSALLKERAKYGQLVRLQYVKGHSGERGNDGADAQANLGAMLPPVPERDWEQLVKSLQSRLQDESRKSADNPVDVPFEVDVPGESIESPMKVRRVSREDSQSLLPATRTLVKTPQMPTVSKALHTAASSTASSSRVAQIPPSAEAHVPPAVSPTASSMRSFVRPHMQPFPRATTASIAATMRAQAEQAKTSTPQSPSKAHLLNSPQRTHGAGLFPREPPASPTRVSAPRSAKAPERQDKVPNMLKVYPPRMDAPAKPKTPPPIQAPVVNKEDINLDVRYILPLARSSRL